MSNIITVASLEFSISTFTEPVGGWPPDHTTYCGTPILLDILRLAKKQLEFEEAIAPKDCKHPEPTCSECMHLVRQLAEMTEKLRHAEAIVVARSKEVIELKARCEKVEAGK